MPIQLNGTYWTINELADELGKSYTTIRQKLLSSKALIKLGSIQILDNDTAMRFIEEERKQLIVLSTAASYARVSLNKLLLIIDAGFPCQINASNQKCLSKENIDILSKAYIRATAKSGWNKKKSPESIVNIARKMMQND